MSTTKVFKRIRLGDDVSTYCGKCKEERAHQVVAMNNSGDVERVVCRTCQSTHLYRARKIGAAKRAGAAPRQTEAAVVRAVRPYSSSDAYQIDDWIAHPKFGQGRVVEVRPGKVTVRFGPETRTLLQAG